MIVPGESGHVQRVERIVRVDHVSLKIREPFDAFRAALERTVPRLDPAYAADLEAGQVDRARGVLQDGPALSIFVTRNHGALPSMWGGSVGKAVQYEIGNPLTASSMTRYQLAAALYAPLRVVLYEKTPDSTVVEYDLPSTLFGQFGDERVTAVGRKLDDELLRVLLAAAT
jgi:hypothetical protein